MHACIHTYIHMCVCICRYLAHYIAIGGKGLLVDPAPCLNQSRLVTATSRNEDGDLKGVRETSKLLLEVCCQDHVQAAQTEAPAWDVLDRQMTLLLA